MKQIPNADRGLRLVLRLGLLVPVTFALATLACDISLKPCVQVSGLVFYTGPWDGGESRVGLSFVVGNVGQNRILNGDLRFELFAGGMPLPDQAHYRFRIAVDFDLDPGQEKQFTVPLDAYFWFRPDGDVAVRGFYFSLLKLADGSVWKDEFSRFAYPYGNRTVHTEDSAT